MRVKDLTTNAISNVERVRIPYPHLTAPSRTAPFTLFAVLLSTGPNTIYLQWTAPLGATATGFEIYKNGVLLTTTGAGVSDYSDSASINEGDVIDYAIVALFSGGNTSFVSALCRVTVPRIVTAHQPSAPAGSTRSSTVIDWDWILNGATGAVTFEYKVDDGVYTSGWTSVSLSAGTTTYRTTVAATAFGTLYAARVTVTDAGTSPAQ
jgi:hypothetical protein